jgi:hypothetical protein
MRPLRWKRQYLTGDPQQDDRNRAVVACLNSLLDAARQHDHCREVEEVLGDLTDQADHLLSEHDPSTDVAAAMRGTMLRSLPLPPHGSPACRQCGVCDLAKQKVEQRLEGPVRCMGLRH